jgi:hypothetical protein
MGSISQHRDINAIFRNTRMRISKANTYIVLILFTVLSTKSLFAQHSGLTVTKSGQITEGLYMTGATVQVLADVEGDVVALVGV